MSRIGLGATLGACLLFTAIACTPTRTPPEKTPTPTPTKSVKAEKPTMPAAAKERSDAGARAFVVHYYALIKYGHATGDWTELKRLSEPSCATCKRFWREDGWRFPPDDRAIVVTIDTAELKWPRHRGLAGVGWGYGRWFAKPTPGKAQKVRPGHHWSDVVQMFYRNGQWKVDSIDVTKAY